MNIVNFISKINKTNTIIYDAINMKQTYYKILNSHKSSMLNCECFKILEEYKDSTLVFPRHYGRNIFLCNLYNYCK